VRQTVVTQTVDEKSNGPTTQPALLLA